MVLNDSYWKQEPVRVSYEKPAQLQANFKQEALHDASDTFTGVAYKSNTVSYPSSSTKCFHLHGSTALGCLQNGASPGPPVRSNSGGQLQPRQSKSN